MNYTLSYASNKSCGAPKVEAGTVHIKIHIWNVLYNHILLDFMWTDNQVKWITEHTSLTATLESPRRQIREESEQCRMRKWNAMHVNTVSLSWVWTLYLRRNLLSRINAISASFFCLRTEMELSSEWTSSKWTQQGNLIMDFCVSILAFLTNLR